MTVTGGRGQREIEGEREREGGGEKEAFAGPRHVSFRSGADQSDQSAGSTPSIGDQLRSETCAIAGLSWRIMRFPFLFR